MIAPLHANGAEYRFSPVNQYGINLTAAYWNPIIAYVSDKSGVTSTLKLGRTSADTTASVLAQEVEFVFSNHLFSPERRKLGWRVFARRNTPPVKGEIIVPFDSPITDLLGLDGKAVSYAGPEALIGYKIPHAELLSRNLKVQAVFGGNQDAALVQLFAGKVQATGGNGQLLAGYAKRENKSYRVLWSSGPVHDLTLFASSKVAERDFAAVRKAFIDMATEPKNRDVLIQVSQAVGLVGAPGFVASDGSEYETERRFYETAPASLR